jgi:asparagine synthase (glutamine-hydrolysing)
LGQKPLYYAEIADGVIFGSELKCLAVCGAVPQKIDHESIYHYFTLGYIPHPWTIYLGVRQLPPAGRLVLDGERETAELDCYWQVEMHIDPSLSREEAGEELSRLVDDSVKLRMISDVPLGAFLSGGLDSSIIVALMARHSSSPVKTFHIDFSESDYSERTYARAVAERFGTDHHELVVRPSAVDVLDDLVHCFDEPFGDSSAVPTWYVSQLTRQHVTVALAGDGGDESFGGYERYSRILNRPNMPANVRRSLGGLGTLVHHCLPRTAPGRRYFRSLGLGHHRHFVVGTSEFETRELLAPEFLETIRDLSTYESLRAVMDRAGDSDRLQPYSAFDLHYYLPDDICVKVDRMSMAHSLELRAPFLDYRVVEFAARLPAEWKIQGDVTKVILKETFGNLLPEAVMKQRKWGFALPMEHWLRGELRPALEEAISDHLIAESGIFRLSEIRALADEHWSGARNRTEVLWRYLFFRRWWHKHRDQASQPAAR